MAVSRFTIVRSASESTGVIASSTWWGSARTCSASGGAFGGGPSSVSHTSGKFTSPANANVTALPLPRAPRVVAVAAAAVVLVGDAVVAAVGSGVPTEARSSSSSSRADEITIAPTTMTTVSTPAIT